MYWEVSTFSLSPAMVSVENESSLDDDIFRTGNA